MRTLPRKNHIVVALLPVEWFGGVLALWLLPQHVGTGNAQPPDPAAWVVVAAIVALQLAALLWRNGQGVAPLIALIVGLFCFIAVTLLEAIAHATLI